MSSEMVDVLNIETGERGRIRRRLFSSKRFNNGILVEVDANQKPYVPELYKSKVTDDTPEEVEDETEADYEDDEDN